MCVDNPKFKKVHKYRFCCCWNIKSGVDFAGYFVIFDLFFLIAQAGVIDAWLMRDNTEYEWNVRPREK